MIKKKDYPMGSISHGTLRNSDLLEAFSETLKELDKEGKFKEIIERVDYLQGQYDEDELNYPESTEVTEDISYLINEDLFNALNEFAAPCFYFGSHPGDGSDFGFWLTENDLEEWMECDNGVVCKDSLPSYIMVVNDHGNKTLYSIDDEGQLTEEWSVV